MAFIDRFSRKATETTGKVVQKAKDMSDIAKYNSMIAEEETKIQTNYSQIGKMYFAMRGANPDPEFAGFVQGIIESNKKIESYHQQIMDIRGVRRCPNCGAEVPLGSAFCSACGTPMPKEPSVMPSDMVKCPHCGSFVKKGVRFCTSCGTPMETFVPPTAAPTPAPMPESAPMPAPAPAPAPAPMPEPVPEQPTQIYIPDPAPEQPTQIYIPDPAPAPAPAPEPVQPVAPAASAGEKICPNCGARMDAGVSFCTNCGTKL